MILIASCNYDRREPMLHTWQPFLRWLFIWRWTNLHRLRILYMRVFFFIFFSSSLSLFLSRSTYLWSLTALHIYILYMHTYLVLMVIYVKVFDALSYVGIGPIITKYAMRQKHRRQAKTHEIEFPSRQRTSRPISDVWLTFSPCPLRMFG